MKHKLTRRLITLLLILSVFLPGCTGSTAVRSTGKASSAIALPADTARLLCPPSLSTKNPCVSWNS